MAVDVYTGTLGSGKSLDATLVIEQCLNKGMNVIANYRINLDAILNKPTFSRTYTDRKKRVKVIPAKAKFFYVPDETLNVRWLVDYWEKYHGKPCESATLIVIDEASMTFNARDWSAKSRSDWIKFIRHSRKLGFDIIMITQMISDIDKQIRGLFDFNVIHKKLTSFKIFKFLTIFGFNYFVKIYVNVPLNEKSNSEIFAYKKRYSTLYDTYEMFMNIRDIFDFE